MSAARRSIGALVALAAALLPLDAQRAVLAPERIDSLDAASRSAWTAYLARSRQLDSASRASMAAELRTSGQARMRRAPFSADPFVVTAAMDGRWLASDSGRALVASLMSYQTPAGGWSKHVDFRAHRRAPGESWFSESDDWQWIGTLDQGATTTQLRLLLAAANAGVSGAGEAARHGIEYLLDAQMPSGCWPQVYPLMGGYHDAVAIADDANARAIELLRDVARPSGTPVTASLRGRAGDAYRRGIACVVRLQRAGAAPGAGWALFHDPISGAPEPGRTYEPAALAPLETAALLDVLLTEPDPDAASVQAAHAAAAWLSRQGLSGLRYYTFTLSADPSAPPLWPRLVSLDDGRPLFANRDGLPRRDWNELTDRRSGYVWFGTAPAAVLERYAAWSVAHPATGAFARARSPIDSIAALPGRRPELDTTSLLTSTRLARLPAARRDAWTRYVARSRALAARDHAAMDAGLALAHRTEPRPAAWTHDFEGMASQDGGWFASDTARRVAESILSFQTPSGGWSKHVDFRAGIRLPAVSFNGETTEWRFIPTIDNGSTTEELIFLSRLDSVRHDARYFEAFVRGVRYLLDAQMPNGCWPQVFPLQGGYHDAATFNDDAIVHVARLLREVGAGRHPIADARLRSDAAAAAHRAVDCMVDAQVVVRGRPTVWAQQSDALTLAPVNARSYELASLGPDESTAVAEFLLSEPSPSPRTAAAVDAAARWFRENEIRNLAYSHYALTHVAAGSPLWGRMVEIGSGRPIFANRDGVRLYDYDRLTDRRTGYRWFTTAPLGFLREYDRSRAASRSRADLSARPD